MNGTVARALKGAFRIAGLDLRRARAPRSPISAEHLLCWVESANTDPVAARFLQHCRARSAESRSQLMQDLFVDFVLDTDAGYFVEFGACDGVSLSNTVFLESRRAWGGILAEPARRWHRALSRSRPAAEIDTRCVWDTTGDELEFAEARSGELSTAMELADPSRAVRRYTVPTVSLNDLLAQHAAPENVDYLSIDTEGSELRILGAFDFERWRPRVLTVEHNYTEQREPVRRLLAARGYVNVLTEFSLFDDWFVDADNWSALLASQQ